MNRYGLNGVIKIDKILDLKEYFFDYCPGIGYHGNRQLDLLPDILKITFNDRDIELLSQFFLDTGNDVPLFFQAVYAS